MNSLPKTVTRQRRGCDLNPGPSAPETSTLNTRLSSHLQSIYSSLFTSYLFTFQQKNQQTYYNKCGRLPEKPAGSLDWPPIHKGQYVQYGLLLKMLVNSTCVEIDG